MNRHTAPWVRKAEEDRDAARNLAVLAAPPRNVVCFHCQQLAEKYFKAMLQELGQPIPRIHDLDALLNRLLHDVTLKSVRRGLRTLTRYAVDFRYPGWTATTRQMRSALQNAERIRAEIRSRLGLPR